MLLLHGSGKTTVLVERIINRIIKDKVDIDKLLVVTFTNAAASEMREKILTKLYEKIEESPENKYLQKQVLLLNKANISTIHAFCLEVIKNYFYEIDISPNFRLGDASEIEILKEQALEEVFDKLYEEKNEDFINLVNTYCGYRDDEELKNLMLKIYNYSQSNPFPELWIKTCIEKFNLEKKLQKDFSLNEWGKIIILNLKEEILNCINILKQIQNDLKKEIELEKYLMVVTDDIYVLEELEKANEWERIYELVNTIKFKTWPIDRKIVSEVKDSCKEQRDIVKKKIKDIKDKFFTCNSENANKDILEMYSILKKMEEVLAFFNKKYIELKREKNIIDFNDIEHYALEILVKKDENGQYIATDTAKEYQEKFEEIAIDEYQDSNLVQEYILNTISRKNNLFMVGDVKQSIYKFRQARPEMFLEKYDTYKTAESNNNICSENTKIQLFQNFRSRKDVLSITNLTFQSIMSKKLGDIEYDKSEYLNLGSEYPKLGNKELETKPELNIIDLTEETTKETNESENNEEDEKILLEKNEIEANFVANRIKKIFDNNYLVYDRKQGYRPATFKDIVILLRTTSNIAGIYQKELEKLGFPVFSDVSNNYFETMEIKTVMAVLKIIDNPNNDIPLITVLRSPICNITDNELIEIRLKEKNISFYEALLYAKETELKAKTQEKINRFIKMLEDWQLKQEYLKLDELIWYIYESTGYYNYVQMLSDGDLRTANLKLLFEKAKDYEKASFKGLYNFINYIERLSKRTGDTDSAKLIGENENVIRIMSIHKSKGLEFPIVFLSGTGKQFNMQDLNEKVLLHQDLGFGATYINYERKIEYNTLAKEAIKIKLKTEIMSEEMRLLYVALTRSKEKLIITGTDKNLEKSLANKNNILEVEKQKNKINENILKKSKSYLDLLELVYLYNMDNIKDLLDVNFIKANKEEPEEEKNKNVVQILTKKTSKEIIQKLNWKYKNLENTKIEGKTSVSKITKEKQELNMKTPDFAIEKGKITNAEKGSLVHLLLQKIDFTKEYNMEIIRDLLNEQIEKNIITEEQGKAIDVDLIFKFTKTDLFKKIRNAKEICKEKPFYINISADEIYNNCSNEKILVQGIIDLYFIEKNGNVILVDYKTDYAEKDEDLIKKYKGQLEIYKRALEDSLKTRIKEVYIYSTYMNKEIIIN